MVLCFERQLKNKQLERCYVLKQVALTGKQQLDHRGLSVRKRVVLRVGFAKQKRREACCVFERKQPQ